MIFALNWFIPQVGPIGVTRLSSMCPWMALARCGEVLWEWRLVEEAVAAHAHSHR